MTDSKLSESKHSWSGPAKKKFGKQLTHFLCFPLLSDEILQPFASSLEYFRSITTAPIREHPLKARQRAEVERQKLEVQGQIVSKKDSDDNNIEKSANVIATADAYPSLEMQENDLLGNTAKATSETFEESLKIIPSISHRPLGTYHLTIGVMDLSEPEQFKKCEEILNSLDLRKLLADAHMGPPNGSKVGRKWKHGTKNAPEKKEFGEKTSSNTVGTASIEPEAVNTAEIPSTDPSRIHISLLGLGAFNSPRQARVLYAHPHEEAVHIPSNEKSPAAATSASFTPKLSYRPPFPDRLYNFALHIEASFRAAGLIKETRPLTLHATLVNIRHKVQSKGGRTSKGKAWTHGRKRWGDSYVDARLLCRIFNEYSGDLVLAKDAFGSEYAAEYDGHDDDDDDDDDQQHAAREVRGKQDDQDKEIKDRSKEFVWAQHIPIDRVALCELGAKKSNDEFIGLEYPPVMEKWIWEKDV